MYINSRMNKEIRIYLYNGILLSNKKEQVIDSRNNMDESQKHAEWWQLHTEEKMLYDSVSMKV